MSFAFFSSGEKDYDEDGEVTYVLPSDWTLYDLNKAKENGAVEKRTIILPKEFTTAYYVERRDKYPNGSREWWDWEKLRKFAYATLDLLRSSFQAFVKNFKIDITEQKIPAFLLMKSDKDIKQSASNLLEKEKVLADQFSHNRRSFASNKVKRHRVIARLQDRAKLAWGMYYSLMGYYPVITALNLSKMKSNQPLDASRTIKMYAICEKTKYNVLKLDKPVSSSAMQYYEGGPHPDEIYPDTKMVDLYDEAMKSFGLNTSNVFADTIVELQPELKKISDTNVVYGRLIAFYQHYVTMRRLLWKIKCINSNLDSGSWTTFAYEDHFREFSKGSDQVDLYQLACDYYKSCFTLLDTLNNVDPMFIQDVGEITGRFEAVIEGANKHYRASHLVDDNSDI